MIAGAIVIFHLWIQLPGQHPFDFEYEVKDIYARLNEVHAFLIQPSHKLLIEGGLAQVGCRMAVPPSREH